MDDFLSEEGRVVFFFDEGRFGLKSTVSRVWAKRGVPVEVKKKDGYESFYIYSAVSHHSGDDFHLFLPEVNTEMMNTYLEHLSHNYKDKEIMLIMDKAGWHRAKDLCVPQNVILLFLPPYSPQLNPVEKLWKWIRSEATHTMVFDTITKMMDSIQNVFPKLTVTKLSTLCHCSYL